MYKLLIVDDEPLIQLGIKSMLNWADFGIEVCGTAANGSKALEIIEKESPQIVITDIRMPIMSGLELARVCRDTYGKIPLFIMLTSYEEFQLVREAISYQVIDYLVKLELSPESLAASVNRALERLKELKRVEEVHNSERPLLLLYREKFFLRLLHSLFETEEQFRLQAQELNLDFSDRYYTVVYCEIQEAASLELSHDQLMNLCSSTIQIVRDILNKYLPCYLISLDIKHFSILFHFSELCEKKQQQMMEALENACTMVHNYFNVSLLAGIGSVVDASSKISESYQSARIAASSATICHPIRSYSEAAPDAHKNFFNIALFKNDITRAFEEFDTEVLFHTMTELTEIFSTNPLRYLQAIDGACNILYLAISLLPDGEATMDEIFSGYPDGYRSIYRLGNVEQVVEWMTILRDGLCETLKAKRSAYKNHIITNVQKYIQDHLKERLTLNDISALFGLSPNYLSVLFKKNCGIGFSEYISQAKISKAKTMLLEQDMKIYEVADQLGFESAFYFSKVFKKVAGLSPREFIQHKTISDTPDADSTQITPEDF